ncbi:MAG: NCS2 family permease [Anaerovibrio sp.]|nr:NCS2 family permease [Selenomonadaceae bacterium]MDD6397208.1 NCS2 family permease [Selenomonadaceae bacterium]MDY6053779.1 NCS2 family permease [Anaerovibrio sp.]
MNETLEKIFHLKEHGTNVRTEILAGITTFMTMAYILAVNPNILGATGMDAGAVFAATAIGACVGTLLMAGLSNYPFVLAPGMGLNAFFAYTVCGQLGYSWQVALAAVFVEGIIFIILSLTKVREAIFNCIPPALKYGVTSGIGLFIAFIGLQNAKIVVAGPTLVSLYPFRSALLDGSFHTVGIGALLALLGTLLIAILMVKKVPGGILWGIIATWMAGMICEATGVYIPNPEMGMFSVMPHFGNFAIPSLAPTFMQMDFSMLASFNFLTIIITFMFVDLFDTLGTLIGVASKANMLDENGRLPKIKGALISDSVATSVGAVLGTSTVTTFVESSSGVGVGGRTGLTSVVSAVLFLASLLLAPIFLAIPAFATAPALIVVGFLMVSSLMRIDFEDITEAVPAYIATIAMPFMYSISEGIAMGVISYVIINVCSGAASKKTISPVVYVLAVIFVLKYIFV